MLANKEHGTIPIQALNEYSDHEVHVYESDDRPGGHANTVKFTNPANGESTMVDMYVCPLFGVTYQLCLLNSKIL